MLQIRKANLVMTRARRQRPMRHLMVTAAVATVAISAAIPAGAALGSHRARGAATLASQVARARLATAKYTMNLGRAKADGYGIITRMIPGMGWHFLNPKVKGFDVRKPPILVYERRGARWQLAALEWVFPKKPAKPPLPGARYGSFGAACHYMDGTFVFASSQSQCAQTSPQSGAKFNFWHPPLVTLHVWVWYPNPSGIFASMNPLVGVYNHG